jgi:hypothetical protein
MLGKPLFRISVCTFVIMYVHIITIIKVLVKRIRLKIIYVMAGSDIRYPKGSY